VGRESKGSLSLDRKGSKKRIKDLSKGEWFKRKNECDLGEKVVPLTLNSRI